MRVMDRSRLRPGLSRVAAIASGWLIVMLEPDSRLRAAESVRRRPLSSPRRAFETRSRRGSRRHDPATTESTAAANRRPDAPRIVFLGDSLTAGYGLSRPTRRIRRSLERTARATAGLVEVVNAGVSGDTSAGGLRRLDWSLQGDVEVLIVALGGNDGLRGLPAAELRQNLEAIVERPRGGAAIRVLLAGMEAPPNFGDGYTPRLPGGVSGLSRASTTWRFIPFFLDGVAGIRAEPGRRHPSERARGSRIVADLVWRELSRCSTAADS